MLSRTSIVQSLAFVVAQLAFSLAVSAGRADELVAVDEGNPPFSYESSTGTAGVYPALIRGLFRRINVPVTIQAMPWKRAAMMADTDGIGLCGLIKTERYEARYDFSAPLVALDMRIYVRRGKAFPYAGLESLRGRRLGVLRGWTYGDAFELARAQNWFDVEEASGDGLNIDKLINNRIDAALIPREAADLILSMSDAIGRVAPLDTPFLSESTYLAFAKSANKKPLIEALNGALAEMRADGSYDLLLDTLKQR
jgi:polar amino acid transport system substrate-binding protein